MGYNGKVPRVSLWDVSQVKKVSYHIPIIEGHQALR